MKASENKTIVIPENVWANTYFSVARYSGRIRLNGMCYVIVDKRGRDIFECSLEAQRMGREKAIEAGEPADLCREDFLPIYRKLGREQFLNFLHDNPDINTAKAARERLKIWQQKTNH